MNPAPVIRPNAFHHITRVEYFDLVGFSWGLLLRVYPMLFAHSTKVTLPEF